MAVSSGFFNSVNHDRLYNADQLSSIFDGVITEGVYLNVGSAFKITPLSEANDTVIVGTGRAWFMHTWTYNDSDYTITLEPPNNFMERIDAIVIDVDKTDSVRKNSILYVQGTAASGATPPVLINEDNHKQYPIAYITRPAGTSSPVLSSQIQYLVGISCPVVTGPLEVINSENFFQQMQGEFEEWFNGIKDTMDENVVTNILQQIDDLKTAIEEQSQQVGLLTKNAYDIFKSGDPEFQVSTFRIGYGGRSLDDSLYKNGYTNSTDPYYYSYENGLPICTFLPDGKVFRVYFMDDNNSGICSDIVTTDGVVTSVRDFNNEDMLNAYVIGNVLTCNESFDVYPVHFDVVCSPDFVYLNNDRYPAKFSVTGLHVSVSSDGLYSVSYIFGDDGRLSAESTGYYTSSTMGSRIVGSITPAKLSDGSTIMFFGATVGLQGPHNGVIGAGIVKMSSDGVASGIKLVTESVDAKGSVENCNVPSFWFPRTTGTYGIRGAEFTVMGVTEDDKPIVFSCCGENLYNFDLTASVDESTGKITFSACDRYHIIDPDTLSITKVSCSNVGDIPNFHIGNYSVETAKYALSEKNGVTISKSNSGGAVLSTEGSAITDEKLYDYFMAASNKAVDIPEGTYTAYMNDSGTLVGLSPSGGIEIVGSNGGAALFKNVSGSIDTSAPTPSDSDIAISSSFMSPYKNFIKIGNKTGYLYVKPYFKDMHGVAVGSSETLYDVRTGILTYRYPAIIPRVIWMEGV